MGVDTTKPRVAPEVRQAAQRAEDEAAAERVQQARAQLEERRANEEAAKTTTKRRRDRIALVLVSLPVAAGLIYWLTQRRPAASDRKIDVAAKSEHVVTAMPTATAGATTPATSKP